VQVGQSAKNPNDNANPSYQNLATTKAKDKQKNKTDVKEVLVDLCLIEFHPSNTTSIHVNYGFVSSIEDGKYLVQGDFFNKVIY
jgi:hypothetical protein